MKRLLIVAHAPSHNTRLLCDAVLEGARADEIDDVAVECRAPLATEARHVLEAQALLLGTTENLGYMAGATKDFFDRCYYPCLDRTDGLPFAFYVRAGHDGTGTCRAISSITTGLRWRAVHPPLVCRGPWQDRFVDECRQLGMLMAAGLETGVL
ncbi:MAG: flavodoxin family protein [Geminicoccaceae bacterium]|nr:flavodoxin family protein [Geminicoccaceae bacterium]